MAADPNKILTSPAISQSAKTEVEELIQSGLAEFTLRQLLGSLVSSASLAERKVYLENTGADKPNGFYDRSLQLGSIPVEVRVPRSRTGEFRPATLPSPYQRGYSEEIQALLVGLLGSSRALNAAKDALRKMGLSGSEQDLERVADSLVDEPELRNSRPLHADMLAVFVDGRYVEMREGDKLRTACIYVVSVWPATAGNPYSAVSSNPPGRISTTGNSSCAISSSAASAAS